MPSAVDPSLTDDGTTRADDVHPVRALIARRTGPRAPARPTRSAASTSWPSTRPNVPDAVIHHEVLAPPDLERIFGLVDGSIFQGEQGLDQMAFMRPSPLLAQYATPVDGLYLCGAGTHPGGGVMARLRAQRRARPPPARVEMIPRSPLTKECHESEADRGRRRGPRDCGAGRHPGARQGPLEAAAQLHAERQDQDRQLRGQRARRRLRRRRGHLHADAQERCAVAWWEATTRPAPRASRRAISLLRRLPPGARPAHDPGHRPARERQAPPADRHRAAPAPIAA